MGDSKRDTGNQWHFYVYVCLYVYAYVYTYVLYKDIQRNLGS